MKNRLKELRKKLGLKQRDIADKLGVKISVVGGWEIGQYKIPDARIFQICKLYNVREDWLRYGTGEMFEPGASLDDRLCGVAKELFDKLDASDQGAVVRVLERLVKSFGGEVKKPKDNRPAWEIINERNGFGNLQINKGTINGDWRQE